MYILLFFVSCISGILYFWFSEKVAKRWIQIIFAINGGIFTMIALGMGGILVYENKAAITSVVTNFSDETVLAETKELSKTEDIQQVEKFVEKKSVPRATTVRLKAPLIAQLPELPRGCEVTSLAMLLEYHQIETNKMNLAKQVKKDVSSYKVIEGEVHFGNPYQGFVGDMYSFDSPGLGVFHGPIRDLAKQYAGDLVDDFTGEDFSSILDKLNQGYPVWVIINAAYKELPEESFTTWQTDDGPINITKRQHSVLITGYDEEYIYFNDPLQREEKALIEDFKAAWIQMGKQAITIHSS